MNDMWGIVSHNDVGYNLYNNGRVVPDMQGDVFIYNPSEYLYMVSKHGRVARISTTQRDEHIYMIDSRIVRKQRVKHKGKQYYVCDVYDNTNHLCELIMMQWNPRPHNNTWEYIRHINGNTLDDSIENLEWLDESTTQTTQRKAHNARQCVAIATEGGKAYYFPNVRELSLFLGQKSPTHIRRLLNTNIDGIEYKGYHIAYYA